MKTLIVPCKLLSICTCATFFLLLNSCKKDIATATSTPLPQTPPAPVAALEYNMHGNMAPVTIDFVSTSMNASTVKWDFGDGFTSNETHVKMEYLQGGDHFIKLIASGPGGSDTVTQQVHINDAARTMTITSLSIAGLADEATDNEVNEISSPDLYFSISDTTDKTRQLFQSDIHRNANTFPLTWQINVELPVGENTTKTYTLSLWEDDIYAPDDLIGSLQFSPSDYMTLKQYYPGEIQLTSGATIVTLNVKWQ